MASNPPCITPNRSIASMAYCEQVGVKRQLGGVSTEMRR